MGADGGSGPAECGFVFFALRLALALLELRTSRPLKTPIDVEDVIQALVAAIERLLIFLSVWETQSGQEPSDPALYVLPLAAYLAEHCSSDIFIRRVLEALGLERVDGGTDSPSGNRRRSWRFPAGTAIRILRERLAKFKKLAKTSIKELRALVEGATSDEENEAEEGEGTNSSCRRSSTSSSSSSSFSTGHRPPLPSPQLKIEILHFVGALVLWRKVLERVVSCHEFEEIVEQLLHSLSSWNEGRREAEGTDFVVQRPSLLADDEVRSAQGMSWHAFNALVGTPEARRVCHAPGGRQISVAAQDAQNSQASLGAKNLPEL
eukprot:GHVT01011438.1.p1 GENE.GHVT01011438.1~~GHVT01011438.1.p1  ORF type:complete len:321 (+),score=67.57 GHVT01011438.1:110-1072(+)